MAAVVPATDYGFKCTATQLRTLVEKALDSKTEAKVNSDVFPMVEALGGFPEISKAFLSDPVNGIDTVNGPSVQARQTVFGVNRLPERETESFLELCLNALKDPTLIVLICSALLSLGLGLGFECMLTGWIEGAVILIAVVVVVLVGAINDYQKEKQFKALNAIKDDVTINVVRNGKQVTVSTFDIVAGDLVELAVGDMLCADGIFLHGNDLKVNEASLTGESDDLRKGHYRFEHGDVACNPFLFGATKIMEGSGKMIVVAVGVNSYAGSSAALMQAEEESVSIMQRKLNKMAEQIGKLGLIVAAFVFVILLIRFAVVRGQQNHWDHQEHWKEILEFLITAITVLVVAVPEGLPLAVTIALAFSVKKMLTDNNLVRHLSACETMGSATTICSDKTGTLTTNRMTVVKAWSAEKIVDRDGEGLSPDVQKLIVDGIALNSSARLEIPTAGGEIEHIGNKTECGLLQFCHNMGHDYAATRRKMADVTPRIYTFSSARKRMSTLYPWPDGSHQLFTKGAPEMVLELCTMVLDENGQPTPLSETLKRRLIDEVILSFAKESLRTLCIAARSIKSSENVNFDDLDQVESGLTCLCIVGIEDPVRDEVPPALEKCRVAGITVRMVTGDNIVTARSIAGKCGIAAQVEDGNYLAMEGPEFRAKVTDGNGGLNQSEVDKIWPTLLVLARSSPKDKHMLVSGIMASRATSVSQVVAVTGDGTNDGPALKKADVGFAMGIAGTSVAKEASDIILMDDNFSSIVKAVMWGRAVYDNICKFLMFQLTVNLAAIMIAVLGACVLQESPLKAIHLLWINLIMDSLASLALATEGPSEKLLHRKPYGRNRPLLSPTMLRNMVLHSCLQIGVMCYIIFALDRHLCIPSGRPMDDLEYGYWTVPDHCRANMYPGYEEDFQKARNSKNYATEKTEFYDKDGNLIPPPDPNDHCALGVPPTQHYTIVFNVFVLMQLFNEINSRRINNEANVFEGFLDAPYFLMVVGVTTVLQIILIFFGGLAFHTTSLTWDQWLISIAFGAFELVWYQIIRFVPADLFAPLSNFLGGHGFSGKKLSAEEEEYAREQAEAAQKDSFGPVEPGAKTKVADNAEESEPVESSQQPPLMVGTAPSPDIPDRIPGQTEPATTEQTPGSE